MPDNDTNGSPFKLGESLMALEHSQESQPKAEDATSVATNNNESGNNVSEPAEEAVTQIEETNDSEFQSGTVKARKLGESRRKLASTLLESATESDSAKQNFIKLVETDKELEKYFKKHFPKQYQTLTSEPIIGEEIIDKDSMKQAARAELLIEEIQEEKAETVLNLAKKLKFTELEAEELKSLASKLEGTPLGGKELDFDGALLRAARIIRPDKAQVGFPTIRSGIGETSSNNVKAQQENERLADLHRTVTRVPTDREKTLTNLAIVDKNWNPKTNKFTMPLN